MSPVRALGLGMVALVVVTALVGPVGWRSLPLLIGAVLFAAASGVLLLRRPSPAASVVALAGASGGVLLISQADPTLVPVGLFVVGAMAPLARPEWAGLVLVGVATAGYVVVELLAGRSSWTLPATAAGVVFFALIGRLMLRERDQREQIAALLADLEASRSAERDSLAQAERARMARELHDVLAHTLSGLAIQLETARLLAAQENTEPALRTAVERARTLARTGLDEARRAVGALRGDQWPGPRALVALVEEHRLATGAPVRFDERGEPFELSDEVRLTLYRVAQEALSNARKHAPGAPVAVSLEWSADVATLTVENERASGRLDGGRTGYGVAGMRERAELVGASLEAGPTATGFRVRLALPRGSAEPTATLAEARDATGPAS